jgi:hypothetical protein
MKAAEKQPAKKAEIVFGIKGFAPLKPAVEPLLREGLVVQRGRIFFCSAHQCHRITRLHQRSADADHALVEVEVVGNGEADFFQNKGLMNLQIKKDFRGFAAMILLLYDPDGFWRKGRRNE